MQPLSDHRHSKGFTGKFRYIIKDPNEGLDYASTLKYKKSTLKEELEERQYLRSLIQSCKQAGEMQDSTLYQDKQASLDIIKNVAQDQSDKLMGNPLIGALLKNKQKTKSKNQASNKPDKFSQTHKTFHKPYKKSDYPQREQTYRVVVKNFKDLQEKKFVKYPSSSLLHTNPIMYKERVQISDSMVINSDSEDNDGQRLKSSFGSFKRTGEFKSKKLLRMPLTAKGECQKRHISLPSGVDTAQCSLKNKYFKQKTFFNDTIVYLKKQKKNLLKLNTLKMNDQVTGQRQDNIFVERQNRNHSIDKSKTKISHHFDPFDDIVSKFKQKSSQSKMVRQNYESGFTIDRIWENTSMTSKLYMKCWENKKNQPAAYMEKVKAMNLTGMDSGTPKKRLATEVALIKKPQVPKFRSKSQGRKVKTMS